MATINQQISDIELADIKFKNRGNPLVLRLCEALEAERAERVSAETRESVLGQELNESRPAIERGRQG
jgi:hypothetical protein